MNALRENYFIAENEHNFDSLFAKLNVYNYRKAQNNNRLNESRFNAKYDIRLSLAEQQSVKDFFIIVESKMINHYHSLNEGILDFKMTEKIKKIKRFFEALSKTVIGTVSEFINKILEMLNKLGQKVSEFIESVFGFDGYEDFKPQDKNNILSGISQDQLGFIGAVQQYCANNLKSEEIKNAAKELGSVNEGFSDKLDNWLKNSKILNSRIGKLILGDREKVGGGKISLWKTIGVSIIGSLLLCTIIPMLVSPLGTIGVCITVACKIIWVSRGVIKVLHHRSKTKSQEQSLWNFWTVFQIILVVGTPILFAIPGVKDAVNGWCMEQMKNLGLTKYTDKIAEYFGSGEHTKKISGWKEIEDPDTARNAIIGHDAVKDATLDRFDSFRKISNAGGNVFDYIKKVTSDIGLDASDTKAMSSYMEDFNKLTITGPDCYDHVFGQLKDCKTMQIGFDTSIVKRTFGDTKTFVNVLFDKFKEEGINVNKAKFYNLINQQAWENSSGNRGVIDVISLPDVKSSGANVETVNKVLKEILGDSTVSKGHTVIGVLNTPVNFTKKVAEFVTSFNPKWEFGLLYMPIYKKGLILHNEKDGKDYQINNIKQDVPLKEFQPLLKNQTAQKTIKSEEEIIDAEYEEIKESWSKIRNRKIKELFETENLPTTQGSKELVTTNKNEIAIRQQDAIIKREQGEIEAFKNGDINCTVFYSSNIDNQMAMAFCSPFNLVAINPKVANGNLDGVNQPLFKKGLFKYYTFKADNPKEFEEYLRKQMKDSVLKTYEIVKFVANHYQILKEEEGKLIVGEKAPKGNIPALGNFKCQEFVDIFNGDVDAYIFYKSEYADESQSTTRTSAITNSTQKSLPSPKEQKLLPISSNNPPQVQDKYKKESPYSNDRTGNSNSDTQNGKNTVRGVKNNNNQTNSNNTTASNQQPQTKPNGKKDIKWYQKLWNWMRGKKNESFEFNKKMNSEELYETLKTIHSLRCQGLIKD